MKFAGDGTPGYSGDGGNAIIAEIHKPRGFALNNGTLYISNGDGRIRSVDIATNISILFTSTSAPTTGDELWVLPLAKGAKPLPFLKTVFNERGGQFSPDGNWIAFQSNETGHDEIYIAPFPASGANTPAEHATSSPLLGASCELFGTFCE